MKRLLRVRRPSFTLVELLITMSIVALLATTLVFVMAGALEEARVDRAKAQVNKINELVLRRWEEYRTRPAPIKLTPPNPLPANYARQVAAYKLNATRELMRLELPDRKSDVQANPVAMPSRPTVSRNHVRRVQALPNNFADWSDAFQDAECLYLILANVRDGDGSALDNFKPDEIGDVDGDGMKEVIDPWGNPIRFLRWAPHHASKLQDGNPTVSPDPFDPLKIYGANYALFPLVYSTGPDGFDPSTGDTGINHDFGFVYSTSSPPNNPYGSMTAGAITSNFSADNITSHLLE